MECEFGNTVTAYNNNLTAQVGYSPRFNVGKEEPRFRLGGARLQLMGCTLH
jgi:hypothetical protein